MTKQEIKQLNKLIDSSDYPELLRGLINKKKNNNKLALHLEKDGIRISGKKKDIDIIYEKIYDCWLHGRLYKHFRINILSLKSSGRTLYFN